MASVFDAPVLDRAFYARETRVVARALLGKVLTLGRKAGRIIETEAYLGLDDLAAHASRGVTPRTRVIFGPPGHAYVYLIYGLHECLNLVAEPDGVPGCVLIRALEPLEGLNDASASGPARLTKAMGITRKLNGADVTRGPLRVREWEELDFEVAVTPRIGITKCADWPLRYIVKGNPNVSKGRMVCAGENS
ncbi:MAG: DNA-3-methyladenine glycosylase [Bryobacteraceae bacterium]|nr:DNA-3-methyladenine glycosylase [Bryobacteraceae bacterium]